MSHIKIPAFFLLGCLQAACATTTKMDVVKTQAQGEQEVITAYNRADEEAFHIQNVAEEKADKIIEDANLKIEEIQAQADLQVDLAYDKAEGVEKAAVLKAQRVKRQEFVDRIATKLTSIKRDLSDVYSKIQRDRSVNDRVRLVRLESIKGSLKEAESALSRVKSEDVVTWERYVPNVEKATKKADQNFTELMTSL